MKNLAVGEEKIFLLLGAGQDLESADSNIVAVGPWIPAVGRVITGVSAGTTELRKLDQNGAVLATIPATIF